MGNLNMGHLSVDDKGEGEVNLPKAIMGAIGGALVVGVVYGVVGRFVGEFSYVAFLIGAAAGIGAMKLGGGRSIVAGIVAAVASLVAVLAAKLLVGAPEGVSWVSYHTTMFDILFCYVANPAAAFFAAGTDKARDLLKMLPV
ncbi:MAG: hypothetical protein AAGE52_09815 [Myxococcota bacterium]